MLPHVSRVDCLCRLLALGLFLVRGLVACSYDAGVQGPPQAGPPPPQAL